MNAVITAALPVFALILTGWLAARWNLLGSATDALNRYVVICRCRRCCSAP